MEISDLPVLLLAGGKGTRIQHLLNDLPKPMYPVFNRPFLDYQIDYLLKFGFQNFYISTGYQGHVIANYYRNNKNINIIHETQPLGTGGGILFAMSKIKEPNVIVLNGDTLYLLDFFSFVNHALNNPLHTCIALKTVVDSTRYGTVILDNFNKITHFIEKGKSNTGPGLINAGIYYLNKQQILNYSFPEICSIEETIFPKIIESGIYGFKAHNEFIDIGTPETLHEIENFVKVNNLI
ncbi:MAG: sugar phosphate nucleotidyltransferase [Bacteroidota bacterium]|nr:sugar phosphate nucleotidyltransferase [Bacteroidota bacterium]